ncbi:MAG: GDP-mannose 4,6-dehydratase, partial [Chloroflexota bacterium]
NLGGENERHNIDVVKHMLSILGKPESLIQHVEDRPGHDRRYALDNSKIRELGWQPSLSFDQALERTVRWYADNEHWWRKLKSGEYLDYYQAQYGHRLKGN